MLGRAHDRECAVGAIKLAKEYPFEVSADCMTGLPGQTKENVEEFAEVASELLVDHVSVYMLSVEEGTELSRLIEKGMLTPKSDDEVAELYDTACKALKEKGYERYEISNFAKDGKVSLHNLRYWRRQDYLGLGLSAHSLLGNIRTFNPNTFEEYYSSIDAEVLPAKTEDIIDADGQKEEFVMLALRLKEGIDVDKYNALFGGDFKEEYKYALIKDARYLQVSDNRVAIKDEYLSVMNGIIVDFLK